MLKFNPLLCRLIASMAVLISGSALAASVGIDDDFSTYPVGTKFDNFPQSNPGGWAWSAAYFTMDEGSIEVNEGEGDQKILKVELPFPSSGSGNWRLLCELEKPLELSEDGQIKLQTVLRIPDLDFPMDLLVGIAAAHRDNPLALSSEDFLPIFRFIVSPGSELNQLRYVAKAADGAGEEVNYVIADAFKIDGGEWYDVTAILKPQQETYDIEVRTKDGTVVFETSDVSLARVFPGIAGVGFKNRTTNDLRSAKFDLQRVVLEATD
jgi:hypothetical protein